VGYDSVINITRRFRDISSSFLTTDVYDVTSKSFTFDGVPVVLHQQAAQSGKKHRDLRPAIFFVHGGGFVYDFTGNRNG
jgi:hypothetical protein